jgi:hypothetical protein
VGLLFPFTAHLLFSQARHPRIQDGKTALFHQGEGDSHAGAGSRIRHISQGVKVRFSTRDSQSDFRALSEWCHCYRKASEQAQVFGMT